MTRLARSRLIVSAGVIVANIWLSRSALGYGDFPQLHDSTGAILTGEDIYFYGKVR